VERTIIGKLGKINCHSQADGFTLVELMISMAVGGIVMGAVMTSFLSQHRSYLAQDEVVEMQQNARVAMDLLTRDIRSAGYDPNNLGAGITVAGVNNLVFTRDDGTGALETINYTLVDAYDTESRNDGIVDDLGRDEGGGAMPVAENIEQLEFQYLDKDGIVIPLPASLADIRSIQISILAVASRPDQNFTNTMTYTTASGAIWDPVDDNLRRRLLITTVQCRNLGL
jgi:type IV pilus assembly protein PilW